MLNILLYFFLLNNTAFHTAHNSYTCQVKGVVVAENKQPVANAYLYIVKGEEEALTNAKGEFTITSNEKMPISLTIVHKDFKTATWKVNNTAQPLTITVQHK